ncbi:MAG: molybdopterin-synthase adenylyltransferase MoeB [Deltaproteobacteria bacterium]|jgi:molybdopterin/thiamine biosynthesis adenylyltransferase/rhodanese-related sulfurtransferase|nr:molybdopterin-synthase adenylyltransferase MoeB [Deltaproteobacteria bacterium]
MPSYHDYLQQVKAQIHEISVAELQAEPPPELILDVREPDEHAQGVIPGATLLPRGLLEGRIEAIAPQRSARLVVYCAGGSRSALAASSLLALGYEHVRSLAGGMAAWRSAGGPLDKPFVFSSAQKNRYARHIMLPEVGEAGQAKLLRSRVLLVGAGGLGSPSAYYLAAAGVGTLGIVDDDVVDESNLQRQILHNTRRVGRPKVESAAQTLRELNPDVQVQPHPVRLDTGNVLDILRGYDLVVDGADNFPTRYLLCDASLLLRIPVVHASIFRFEGQLTTFLPWQGPCYRCLYPEPPPPDLAPSCHEAGVLGVLPGVVGVLQATEAIKLLLGIGESMSGRLLIYEALAAKFREMKLRRDPACVVCSDPSRPIELIDYHAFCSR